MRNNESYMSDNSVLNEDLKKIRKLRKVLRQIEHLQLLTRALNSDEKLKISRRSFYREQLSALNLKYKNIEIIEDSMETTMDSEESRSFSLNASNSSDKTNTGKISESFDRNLNELSQRFDTFFIQEESQTKIEEFNEADLIVSSPIENRTMPQVKENKPKKETVEEVKKTDIEEKPKKETKAEVNKIKSENLTKETKKVPEKIVKPKEVKPKIEFESFELNNAHEDLIVSVDICNESNLIATGR